jgi:hypothetical protein
MENLTLRGKILIIGIGAQKTGTTWLYRYLRRHPQVAMSPHKELHYWDERYRPDLCGHWTDYFASRIPQVMNADHAQALAERVSMRDGSDYMQFFAKRTGSDAAAFGEITPSYSLLPEEGFRQLKGLHDQVKIILILRDPVTRFWSGVCHATHNSPASPADLFEHALYDPHHVERTRYDVTLECLDRVFEAGDVLILFHETFFQEKDIRPVTNFIGVNPHPASFAEVVQSRSGSLSSTHARLAREAFAPVYDYCERRFGNAVPLAWGQPGNIATGAC